MTLAAPDFANPAAGPAAAWYLKRGAAGALQACATDAWSIASLTRAELAEQLRTLEEAGQTLPAGPGGAPARALLDEVPPTDGACAWDAALLGTAWALCDRYGTADAARRRDLLAAATGGRPLTRAAVETLLWLAFESAGFRGEDRVYGLGSPEEVSLPSNAVLPAVGAVLRPPPDLAGGLSGRFPRCRATTEAELATLRPLLRPVRPGFQPALIVGLLALTAVAGAYLASRPPRRDDFAPARRRAAAAPGPRRRRRRAA